MQEATNEVGLFEVDDRLGHDVIVIEMDPGPGVVRASNIISASYRLVRSIVEVLSGNDSGAREKDDV